jgi:hypothetical protein
MSRDPQEPPPPAPPAATGSHRLNGWKEIAAHLGKGVRTAQRWEKLYGLPVHRIGREGGEIIFAFRDELDRWARHTEAARHSEDEIAAARTETDPPHADEASTRPARRRLSRRLPAAVLLTGGLAALAAGVFWARERRTAPAAALPSRHRSAATPEPASWRLVNGRLDVLAANGQLVFTRELGGDLPGTFDPGQYARPAAAPVQIRDLEGDGRLEVLLAAPAVHAEDRRLYCFEADGRLRFVHQPSGSVRFGDTEYRPPWGASHVFVTSGAAERSLWAVFDHSAEFPSRLQKLDARGGVEREYWSDGPVRVVTEGRWRGTDVVLVGAGNDETGGGSVAIFDRSGVGGHAPALRPRDRCTSCALGGPREFLVFPRLCLAPAGATTPVVDAWIEGGDRLFVATAQTTAAPDAISRPHELLAFYTLGPDLVPVHAEISRDYQVVHASLERRGLVDHPFGPRDDADVFPVLRFESGRFRRLPSVRVDH